MANLTAEQYDTLQEMLKVINEARQTSERLSESWAKRLANPIGPHTTHLSSPITPMKPSQSPQPPDPPDYKTNLTSKTSTSKKIPPRYSCEEIYERIENGFCIFCEDLDTPGHYNLKHKGSKLCLVESVGDESPDDEKPDEVTVEEISNKSLNMIREKESNLENESRPEVSVSQFQVPLSSLEPSRRCHKTQHNESLDVGDKDMCDEPVCDKDGDYILTASAKFRKIYEDPRFELVCLKQSHDSVEIHLDNFESALTKSSLRHTPTYQYRAPFNPYQNCNDQCHYKREFGNFIGPEIEFDRESEEIEDDELQDKQPEDEVFVVDVETLVMTEDKRPLECDDEKNAAMSSFLCDYNMVCDRQAVLETEKKIEVSNYNILIDPGDATSGNIIQTNHKCVDLENWSPPLEDDFYEIKSPHQHMNNRKVTLRLVIPVIVERVVKREKDYDGALLAPLDDTVAFSNLDAQQLHMQQLDPLLMVIRMIVVPFSTLILMTCMVLELIKDKASKKRKLCKNWRFKYKLNTWLSEALHFWRKREYEKLQRASDYMMCELIYKVRTACHCVVREANQTASQVWYGWKTKAEVVLTISIPIMHLKITSCIGGLYRQRGNVFDAENVRLLDTKDGSSKVVAIWEVNHFHVTDFSTTGQNKAATKALVQWKEHPPDQATWEFYQDMVAKFPDFQP